VLRELDTHCAWLTAAIRPLADAWGTPRFPEALAAVYGPLKKVSIDYALMEHAKDIVAVTGTFRWDDLGSWDALYDHLAADAAGVITQGEVVALGCRDSLVLNRGPQTVVTVGLDGISVVVTDDAILVLPKGRSQEVKQAVDALKASGRERLL
jgi:mannose-1-phosphate guanylyltransferase